MLLPMPLLAPVTSATRPLSPRSMAAPANHTRPQITQITDLYYRNLSGSESPATTSCRNSAALAPSTTRWSDDSVIVICGWTPM